MVGDTVPSMVHQVDARWTMAYAAALGDTHPCYFDTTSPEGVVAHPLFSVCPEWPVIVSSRSAGDKWGIAPQESRQSVHAVHDVVVHRLARPGDELTTSLAYVGVEKKRPGAFVTLRLETVDQHGNPVATTEQGGMYLGVDTTGDDRPATPTTPAPQLPAASETPIEVVSVPIAQGAAHTYTESARIWNPIHTDAQVAKDAGLPGIILHGTATLALGVSKVLNLVTDGDPRRVRRISCRFGAMVLMPSTVQVRLLGRHNLADGTEAIQFDVRNEAGGPAVDVGVVILAP
ncbi:MAG: acyl dehydratase [Candidatus Poriferisodalaceae bacterium]|jgi:acyl dehydratase